VTVGAALDGSDTPETGDKPALERLWDWGFRAGFTSLISGGNHLVHGAISRRTRFPALRELYSGALGRFVPNPDLRPEVLSAAELGVTLTGTLGELQMVGFHQVLSDGIVRTSVSTEEGRKFQRVNRDEVRSSGLELLASVPMEGWLLSGDLTLQSVRGFLPDGQEVDVEYEPSVLGRLGTRVALPLDLAGTADFRFLGEQLCENPEAGGLQVMKAHRTLDLGLRRGFNLGSRALSRAEAVLSVDNVSDGVHLDQCGLPQPGRTLRLQLRLW
jgi:iron complex outermembrane receptor protein